MPVVGTHQTLPLTLESHDEGVRHEAKRSIWQSKVRHSRLAHWFALTHHPLVALLSRLRLLGHHFPSAKLTGHCDENDLAAAV